MDNCRNCGAPVINGKCQYCGTEYEYKEKPYRLKNTVYLSNAEFNEFMKDPCSLIQMQGEEITVINHGVSYISMRDSKGRLISHRV